MAGARHRAGRQRLCSPACCAALWHASSWAATPARPQGLHKHSCPAPSQATPHPDTGSVLLLRELDRQARQQGGAVYMLNGNHESLNVAGDFRCGAGGAWVGAGRRRGAQRTGRMRTLVHRSKGYCPASGHAACTGQRRASALTWCLPLPPARSYVTPGAFFESARAAGLSEADIAAGDQRRILQVRPSRGCLLPASQSVHVGSICAACASCPAVPPSPLARHVGCTAARLARSSSAGPPGFSPSRRGGTCTSPVAQWPGSWPRTPRCADGWLAAAARHQLVA